MVSAPVVVSNAQGAKMVLEPYAEKNFRVLDGGVEQKIEDIELGGAPVSVAHRGGERVSRHRGAAAGDPAHGDSVHADGPRGRTVMRW